MIDAGTRIDSTGHWTFNWRSQAMKIGQSIGCVGGMFMAVCLGACVPVEKSLGDEAVAGGGGSDSGGGAVQGGSSNGQGGDAKNGGAASAHAGADNLGNGGTTAAPTCNPLAASRSAVTLLAKEIVAAGVDDSTGTSYVLSEHESSLRLFVADGSSLLEQFETGTGQGMEGPLEFWTFQYRDDQGLVTVEVDKDASGLRMGVATGEIAGKRFSVGDAGIILTLMEASAAANLPARTHRTYHIEYSGSDANDRLGLVTAPDHPSSDDGYRVFIGPTSALQEQTVTGVSRGLSIPVHTQINLIVAGSAASFSYAETDATLSTSTGTSTFTGTGSQPLPAGVVFECL
jgi:hypothetical protein